jgi:hypothetical protein
MLSGFNDITPVTFLYEHDSDLIVNQSTFATQQGLNMNLVNALSGLKDETILNYSNIYLTKQLPVNDIITLPYKDELNLTFTTYLAFYSVPDIVPGVTQYLSFIPDNSIQSFLTTTLSLSDTQTTTFAFYNIDGLNCKIYVLDGGYVKYLTFRTVQEDFIVIEENPTIINDGLNVFEYSLDENGYLKLFFRYSGVFYIVRYDQLTGTLKAIDSSLTTPETNDIINTTFTSLDPIKFKNDFIYYSKPDIKTFETQLNRTISNIPQNHVIHYSYQSGVNFITGGEANIDFFKTKNVLSDDYYINDKLPFGEDYTLQRDYTSILSKQNSELYEGDLQFNYNYYTKEFLLLPDLATKFILPEILFPYAVINIENTNLVNLGSYGGLTPVFSDKVIKHLDPNSNVVNYNEANGIYLYTWLYTDNAQLTSYWLDRYYYPSRTSINVAYSGGSNELYTYTSDLCAFINENYPQNDYLYYDIRSSLTFEPSATYTYSRIGNKYINKVVDTFAKSVTSINVFSNNNVPQLQSTSISYGSSAYGGFKLTADTDNSFTISFDMDSQNVENINSNLIVGNNFDEGISLYKGGLKNIFTPGYFINKDSKVTFFSIDNTYTFTIDISEFVEASAKILDIVNTGFDHLIKIFYLNLDNNAPGFLDIAINSKTYNKFEFTELINNFNDGGRLSLFDKLYKGNSEIWYLTKPINTNEGFVYKFDYLNNLYLGNIVLPNSDNLNPDFYNSVVSFYNSISTLSGFRGDILEDSIGVSKIEGVVYFKNLSAGTEYPSLCTTAGIFDIAVLQDKFYLQTNGNITSYDKYKRRYNTYYTNISAVSGIKIDFINDGYKPKLLSYSANYLGEIIVDKFDIDSAVLENTYNTGIIIDPIYFGEYFFLTKARYTDLTATGVISNNFTRYTPPFSEQSFVPLVEGGTLSAFNIQTVFGFVSENSNSSTIITGTVSMSGATIPADVTLSLFQDTNLLATVSASGNDKILNLTYQNIAPEVSYNIVCKRLESERLPIRFDFNIKNATVYDVYFQNVIVGGNFIKPGAVTYPVTLIGYNYSSLTNALGFITTANAVLADENYVANTAIFASNFNVNNSTDNPTNNFYHNYYNPHLLMTVLPDISSFTPVQLNVNANEEPPYDSITSLLSGVPFQVPTNFDVIRSINKFDSSDMVIRLDLYSGNNYKNKQTEIIPFNIDNNSQISISFDVNNGLLDVYKDAELVSSTPLSANTFYTSYFLNNNFGVGLPFINNDPVSVLMPSISGLFANYYTLNNFTVFDRALTPDEVKFNFLKNKKIDYINLDVTSGTRNNTDTVASYNKFTIPGRKNNSVKIYIKNAYLNDAGKEQLTSQLLPKIRNIVPLNIEDIELVYINYE